MSIAHVTDGVTDLDSLLFNPIIDAVNSNTAAAAMVANAGTGIYNVLDADYGAVGDGVTDDTDAIQAAIDAAGAAGGGIVYFPAGRYVLSLQPTYWSANRRYRLIVNFDGITLLGAGNKQTVFVSTDTEANGHVTIGICGQAKSSPDFTASSMYKYDLNFNNEDYFTYYPFQTDPVYGEYSVELDNLADAANFSVNDIVYIRAGQTVSTAGEAQPDAEYNRIVGISGAVLNLERPILKNYTQEYFADSDMDTATTTGVTAYPAVFGIANANDSTLDGFAIRGIHFEGSATHYGISISTSQVIDATIECTADTTNFMFQTDGPHRDLSIDANVRLEANLSGLVWVGGDRGCGDMVVSGRFENRGTELAIVHMNEGVANVRFQDAEFINPEFGSGGTVYAQQSRGYRHTLNNVRFQGGGTDALVKFIDVDGAMLDGCDLSREAGKNSLSIGSPTEASNNVVLGVNQYGQGTVGIHHNDTAKVPPRVQPVTLRAWVEYDESTVVVGYLPTYATVLRRHVMPFIVFDGTTPTVSLGHASGATALMSAQDLTAVSSVTDDAILNINPGYEVIATVTTSGATQGRALVIVEYIMGLVPS